MSSIRSESDAQVPTKSKEILTTISCNTAAFAEPVGISRDEEYILEFEKGFIAAGGSTNLGEVLSGLIILDDMMALLVSSDKKYRAFSEILNNAKIRLLGSDPLSQNYAKQYILLGDALSKIKIPKE